MFSAPSTHPDQDAQLRAQIDRSLRHPVMFFLTSGIAWLAVSILLGLVASAKVHDPGLLGQVSWLSYGRVFPAHVNALVYGWGMQAAFAVMLWLCARMSHKPCTAVMAILTAGHIWNLGVVVGVAGILAGNGTGMPWMEFPAFVWPVLLASYMVIVVWSFIQFRVRAEGLAHVAQWYILGAMLWFPWLFATAHALLHWMPGHPVMAAGINAWYKSALIFLFFVPVGLGTAYFLTPKLAGRPVYSDALAKLGFWSLALIAPWAGMQKLAGAPLPYFMPYVGAAATVLLFIPVCAAATNLIRTMWSGRGESFPSADPLRFCLAGIVSLGVLALASVLLNLPNSTLPLTQFSLSGYGLDTLALYGFFSLVMFGAAYLIVPRVTLRGWRSGKLIEMHFLFSVYGLGTVCLVALIGGLQQGMNQENWQQPWMAVAAGAHPYAVATTFAWALILFANVFFFTQLALMWLHMGLRVPVSADAAAAKSAAPSLAVGAAGPMGSGHAGSAWALASPLRMRTLVAGLAVTFGAAWLGMVVVPFFKMRSLEPLALSESLDGTGGIFFPKRSGRIADGARVYAENGCYVCHTQVVRPTYAGNDIYRPDWGGLKADAERGDTRRETNAYDFFGESFAQIGVMRIGPDLSNVGRRVESLYAAGGDPAAWLYAHLYNPQTIPRSWNSVCPPHPFLFERREIKGNPSDGALKVSAGAHHEWVPGSDARALVSYLLSLKKDHKVPAALNFAPRAIQSAP